MRCVKTVFCLILLVCSSLSAGSARPQVGLALGGGGAKGGAHIGVLKVLEEYRIPVDMIAGTSIGSLVGALYAMGYSAQQIEHIMLDIDWEEGYSDAIPRAMLPLRLKRRDTFNVPLNIGHDGYQIKTPSGLLFGQRASMLLRDALGNVGQFQHFDQLPLPYRAVATDLSRNEAVVLARGDLLLSIRASSNVPGILAPVQLDDKLLVDGGIANNLPIDVVKLMGAQAVIAVDIGDALAAKESLRDTFAIMGQLSSFLTFESSKKQKALLLESDVLLQPDIDGLSTTDWSGFTISIQKGEQVAREKIEELKRYALSEADYHSYRAAKRIRHDALLETMNRPVSRLIVNNASQVHPAFIKQHVHLTLGEPLSDKQINQALAEIYSLDEFQFVSATLEDDGGGRTLILETQEKSWGPNFFDFGVGWETNFTDESSIDLDLAYTQTHLSKYGGEWRSQVELGNEPALNSELYFPVTPDRAYFTRAIYHFESINLSFDSSFNLPTSIDQHHHQIRLGAGWNFSRHGLLEAGLLLEAGSLDNDYLLEKTLGYDAFGGYLRLAYDSLDSAFFPTEGKRINISVFQRQEDASNVNTVSSNKTAFGGDTLQLVLDWKGAFNIGSHAFVSKAAMTRIFSQADQESVNVARLGGFLNLSGYSANALSGPNKAFAALVYQYNLRGGMFKKTTLPFYLGFSVEAGNIWADDQGMDWDDLVHAGSVYLGSDTKIGPIALGYGYNDQDQKSVYFYLGYKL